MDSGVQTGAGASVELVLVRKSWPLVTARYRGSYIDVSNGSIYNNDTRDIGLNATHGVHQTQLKLEIPISKSWGIGADASVFFRRSHYDFGTPLPTSEVRNATDYGVLKLTVDADSYAWEFVPVAGGTFTDTGSAACH